MFPRSLRRAPALPALVFSSFSLALAAFPRVALADEPRATPPDPVAARSAPSPPLVAVDSTRPFTVLERRANGVAGWSLTLPFPAYVSTTQWEPVCVAPCGGIVLSIVGVASMVAGVALVGASTAETDPGGALKAGVSFFAPGLVAIILGTTLWIANGSSVVTDDGRSL